MNINANAIKGAIKERLEGVIGGVRAMSVGDVDSDIFNGADDFTKASRAAVRPRFDVRIDEISRNENSPCGPTNFFMYDVLVTVGISYHLQGEPVDVLDYEDRKSIAERQVDEFNQALTFPNTLSLCLERNEATGIASGMLTPQKPLYRVVKDDPKAALFEVEQKYTAVVTVTAATS